MADFADLEERIDALCIRASSGTHDTGLLREIEELLAEGYVRALQGDQRRRALEIRRDALVAAAEAAEELQTIISQQRTVGESTRALRLRLAIMHEHWHALQASAST